MSEVFENFDISFKRANGGKLILNETVNKFVFLFKFVTELFIKFLLNEMTLSENNF